MATIKSYTDIEQSKVLSKILPLESADMVSPFRHTKNDEYIPGYVVSRNYIEVYNEMMKLPGMEKKDGCQLIQPTWSLAALFNVLPLIIGDVFSENTLRLRIDKSETHFNVWYENLYSEMVEEGFDIIKNNAVDACVEMILKLHELNLL